MYTTAGEQVCVISKLDNGFLAKKVFGYAGEDEDEFPEALSEETFFYETLLPSAPTEKYAKEVQDLMNEKEVLENDIYKLQADKLKESSLLSKISKFKMLKQLANYLTGDFKYILYVKTLEVINKDKVYNSPYINFTQAKDREACITLLHNDSYTSEYDKEILVFDTVEEAQKEAKDILLNRINKSKFNYNKVSNLKDILNKVSYWLKKDTEILEAFNKRLSVFQAEEDAENEIKLQDEIKKLELKQQELLQIQSRK